MKFLYVIESINKNGIAETAVQEIERDSILIGRGTSSDMLLFGKLVSLEHARLYTQSGVLIIEDLDSLSGVLVNGSLIKRHTLAEGDRVKIGNFSFTVGRQDGVWCFVERREAKDEEQDLDEIIAEQHNKLRFSSYLPSLTLLSGTLVAVVFVLFLGMPLLNVNPGAWDSGQISNAHKMIENDCSACHAKAFRRVRDEQCMACHSMSDHAENLPLVFEKHAGLDRRCASCHMEHNGDVGLIAKNSSLCSDCHGQLTELLPESKTNNISSFSEHPEFRVTLPAVENDPEAQYPLRLALSKKDKLKDRTQIKLNHKVHLVPDLAGADGLVTMQCMDCHQFTDDRKVIKPIGFEEHCASCHPLEYDERLPGEAVPHGKPDVVFNYLYAEYAKLFLAKEGKDEARRKGVIRRKPGKPVSRGEELEFTRQAVESQSRSMEESIFTRTACHLCHMISERGEAENEPVSGEVRYSAYTVHPPNIPARWMPASTFDHGAHQEIACESCHEGVRDSEQTVDVLLPGIDNCKQCHQQEKEKGMVVSDCVTCHSYHDPLLLNEDTKREIEKILLSLNLPGIPEGRTGKVLP